MNYLEAMQWRYATKKFNPSRKIEKDALIRIIEAGNLSATSLGMQPIKVLEVKDAKKRALLQDASFGQEQVTEASNLLVICSLRDVNESSVNEYIDRISATRLQNADELSSFQNMIEGALTQMSKTDSKQDWMAKQGYIVLGSMLMAAAMEKIDSCPMEGFLPRKVSEILNLDKLNLYPVLLLPLGYRSNEDKYQHLKKVRKSIDEFYSVI